MATSSLKAAVRLSDSTTKGDKLQNRARQYAVEACIRSALDRLGSSASEVEFNLTRMELNTESDPVGKLLEHLFGAPFIIDRLAGGEWFVIPGSSEVMDEKFEDPVPLPPPVAEFVTEVGGTFRRPLQLA